jgi:hypothetical protein
MFKYHYLYKITRSDGSYYIGAHSTNNLDDGYFGSGRKLKKSIVQYGAGAHQLNIIEFFDDREQLYEAERLAVNQTTLADPKCLNLKQGGTGGLAPVGLTPEFRQQHSQKMKSVWSDPTLLLARSALVQQYWETDPDAQTRRLALSEQMKNRWCDSAYRELRLQQLRSGAHSDPIIASATMKEKWTDPAFRAHRSKTAAKKAWVHKDGVAIQVNKTEIDDFLQTGYTRGRGKRPY